MIKIQDFIRKLFQQHECELVDNTVGIVLKRMSKKDFMGDVASVEIDISKGKYKGTNEVFDELEQRLFFIS